MLCSPKMAKGAVRVAEVLVHAKIVCAPTPLTAGRHATVAFGRTP